MTWSPTFRTGVLQSFRNFWRQHDLKLETLDQYITHWRDFCFEEVAVLTGKRHVAWINTVFILVDAYDKDPSILDYAGRPDWTEEVDGETVSRPKLPYPRRVERLLDLAEWGSDLLDEDAYYELVAQLPVRLHDEDLVAIDRGLAEVLKISSGDATGEADDK